MDTKIIYCIMLIFISTGLIIMAEEDEEVPELDSVIIIGETLNETINPKTLKGRELRNIPGAANDALRGIMTLPNIGIPNDFFGVLYIRGSDPYSNLYYFDRTPLGYPFHWGGILSTVSSETLDRIDVYAGGYGAQFGLDAQNVIDIYTRSNIDDNFQGKIYLNILYSEGLLEGLIYDKVYYSISGRRSYLDLVGGLFTESQLPYFSDYQTKLVYPINDNHEIIMNAFSATDQFNFKSSDPHDGSAFFKNSFNAQGIHLNSTFSDLINSKLSLTRSVNILNIDFKTLSITDNDDHNEFAVNRISVNAPVWTLRGDAEYKVLPKLQIEPGLILSYSPIISTSYQNIFIDDI